MMLPRGFLAPHQDLAATRLCRMIELAQMSPRVTLRYEPTPISGGSSPALSPAERSRDARQRLNSVLDRLPQDCVGVLLDVYIASMGLQEIEQARGWPRRSAKLVLRIGLDCLARFWGLAPGAAPGHIAKFRSDMIGDRLPMFSD